MPRGVKKTVDYNEAIATIEGKIAAHKEEIKKLTKQRNKLLSTKKDADSVAALKIIKEKGISPEELLEMLNKAAK